jgi:ABC-type multidrug transport system fused ATPase/permease subunit
MKGSFNSKKSSFSISRWILGANFSRFLAIGVIAQVVIAGLDIIFLALISPFVLSVGGDSQSDNFEVLGIVNLDSTQIFSAIIFTVVLKNICGLTLQHRILMASARREAEVGTALVKASMFQRIDVMKANHSSELLQTFATVVGALFSNLFRPLIAFAGDISTMIAVVLGLLIINTQVALLAMGYFAIFGLIIICHVGKRQQRIGTDSLAMGHQTLRTFTEIRLMSRELRLAHKEDEALTMMNAQRLVYSRLQATSTFINAMPRYILELLLVFGIGALVPFLTHFQSTKPVLPTLALLVAAGYRILPSLNLVIIAIGNFRNAIPMLNRIHGLAERFEIWESPLNFDNNKSIKKSVDFRGSLVFDQVTYGYFNAEKEVFKGFNFNLPEKQTMLIIGPSGSGKTTLIGLAAGTLIPQDGEIYISYHGQSHPMDSSIAGISYLSQDVPLLDESFAYNIALCDPNDFDFERLREAARNAGILERIIDSPLGFETQVGENGSMISAGERQRLGIARSLYSNPGLLILDEPTANLDEASEIIIWETIARLRGQLSILLVSHKLVPGDVYDAILSLGPDRE